MSVEARRKKQESFDAFLRRFNKKLVQSGRLFEARKRRFLRDDPSKNKLKRSAARRRQVVEKKTYLKKVGLLQEDKRRGRGRR